MSDFGEAKVRFGFFEIRVQQDYPEPFPLYPYEELKMAPTSFKQIQQNTALKLNCVQPFTDEEKKVERCAGDLYLIYGPATYIPRIEESILEEVKGYVIKPNTALLVKASRNTKDANDIQRRAGERWLIRKAGAYLPGVDEEIVEIRKAKVLTDKICIHLSA